MISGVGRPEDCRINGSGPSGRSPFRIICRRPAAILTLLTHIPVSPDRQVLDRLEVSTALLASIQEAVQWPVRQPV